MQDKLSWLREVCGSKKQILTPQMSFFYPMLRNLKDTLVGVSFLLNIISG